MPRIIDNNKNFCYCRYSNYEAEMGIGFSIEFQKDKIRDYMKKYYIKENEVEWFIDENSTGENISDQKELKIALDKIKRDKNFIVYLPEIVTRDGVILAHIRNILFNKRVNFHKIGIDCTKSEYDDVSYYDIIKNIHYSFIEIKEARSSENKDELKEKLNKIKENYDKIVHLI